MPHELSTARLLALADRRRPNQSHLKRAMSAVYYSLFDALARTVADALIGRSKRRSPSWPRVYRAVDHRQAREIAKKIAAGRGEWPAPARRFAETFVTAQEQRHRADYDPTAAFARQDILTAIADAEAALEALGRLTPDERLELATRLVFRDRP